MRNLKKLLAVVVAICVLATFTVPAFAADTATTTAAKTQAEVCTDLGVILGSGSGVTADYLATQPDRVQGAIMFLRLKGLESAAKAFTGTDNFSDVEKLNDTNKAILAYLKANPDLGFGGIGDNKYAPLEKMSAKEYYKVLLTALGYTYGTDATADFKWTNVFGFAASKGLLKLIDNDKFTVNDLCIGTVEALKTAVKGGTDTLIAVLVEGNSITADKAIASGLYNPVAKALEVVSATADTVKVAKVVFNKELDSNTIIAANFTNTAITDRKLGDDKKTVYLVFNTQTQSATQDVVIENVKSTDGTKIAKVTKTITFVDTTLPVISGAVATNAKTIVISANEPINFVKDYYASTGNVKIDGVNVIAKTVVDYVKNTLTVYLNSNMTTGTHKVDIKDMTDFANLPAVAQSYNIDVVADTTAPAITSAKYVTPTQIKVTFAEDLDEAYMGSFWVDGTAVSSRTFDTNSKSVMVLNLGAGQTLNTAAIVGVKVEYQYQKDVIGNEVSSKTAFTFTVADDTTLPTVTASISSGNTLTLTFSKTMMASAGTVTIKKASDSSVMATVSNPFTFKNDSDNTVLELTKASTGLGSIAARDIIVNVKGFKDATVRANALPEANLPIKANDSALPQVLDKFTYAAGSSSSYDTVTFYFTEAIDNDTLKNLSNYVVVTSTAGVTPGALTTLGATVKEIASDSKSITLYVPGFASNANAAATSFVLYSIKDIAGNYTSGPVTVTSYSNVLLNASTITAKSSTTIQVVFDQKISGIDTSAFIVTGAGVSYSCVNAVIDTSDATKATLTFDRDMGTSFGALSLQTTTYNNTVKTAYGTTLTAITATNNITDAVGPKVTGNASTTTTATGASIMITFSEVVHAADSAALANALYITKSSDASSMIDLVTTPASLIFYNADGTVGTVSAFTKVQITSVSGITAGTEYKVEVKPWNILDTLNNKVSAYGPTAVTP